MPGRINADTASAALAASGVALGAGWGNTATAAVTSGSNAQRGQVVVSSAGTGQAQATATVTITFPGDAWETAPFAVVVEADNTQVATGENITDIATTTTTLSFKHGVLPVAAKDYTYNYVVLG